MNRKTRVVAAATLAAGALASLGGCVAALVPAAAAAQAAGSGIAFWEGKKLKQAFPATAEAVSTALDRVILDLSLQVDVDAPRASEDDLLFRMVRLSDDDEELCAVRIEWMTESLTYVVMTPELFGKRAAVALLMEQVQYELLKMGELSEVEASLRIAPVRHLAPEM